MSQNLWLGDSRCREKFWSAFRRRWPTIGERSRNPLVFSTIMFGVGVSDLAGWNIDPENVAMASSCCQRARVFEVRNLGDMGTYIHFRPKSEYPFSPNQNKILFRFHLIQAIYSYHIILENLQKIILHRNLVVFIDS